jgi:hypothetical protein
MLTWSGHTSPRSEGVRGRQSTTARMLWKQKHPFINKLHHGPSTCRPTQRAPRACHQHTYHNACSPPVCFVSVRFTPRAHPCMHKTTNEWQGRGDTDGRRPVCALPRPSTRNKVLPCFAFQTTVAVGGCCGRSHRRTAIPRIPDGGDAHADKRAMLVLGVGRASRLRTTWRLRVEQKLSLHP